VKKILFFMKIEFVFFLKMERYPRDNYRITVRSVKIRS